MNSEADFNVALGQSRLLDVQATYKLDINQNSVRRNMIPRLTVY